MLAVRSGDYFPISLGKYLLLAGNWIFGLAASFGLCSVAWKERGPILSRVWSSIS